MEWVHATDSMGMSIYEADILKMVTDGKEWVGVVWWGVKGCALVWDISVISDNNALSKASYLDDKHSEISIIGNVYENRELVSNLIELGGIGDFEMTGMEHPSFCLLFLKKRRGQPTLTKRICKGCFEKKARNAITIWIVPLRIVHCKRRLNINSLPND